MPLAILVTWTCYGTWLPGDSRGHVSNVRLPGGGFIPKRNTPRTPCAAGDEHTRQTARSLQKWPTVLLDQAQAETAARALLSAATERGWTVVRAAVMNNHVHVLVANCPDDGSAVRRVLKGVSQAALSRTAGGPRRWWTAGGSDRYKHDPTAVAAASAYVARQRGKLAGITESRLEGE